MSVNPEIIVIGASLGGLVAMETVLSGLSGEFKPPIAVVMHRGTLSGDGLLRTLRRHTSLEVREAQDKDAIVPGRITLAPPDYHLLVERGAYALSTEAPVLYARPSIDVLFESAADAYHERVLAIVLTGASCDGARGAARIKALGGKLVVQSPPTAESPVMPKAAIDAAQPDQILPLAEIGPFLTQQFARNGPQ